MDIFEQWKIIEKEKFTHSPIKREEIMNAIYQESIGVMDTLKLRLKYKINWVIAIGLGITAFGIYNMGNTGVLLGCGIAVIYYIFGYFSLKKFHRAMDSSASDMSTLEILKNNHKLITDALKSESRTGAFFFPIVIAAALIMSGSMNGLPLMEIVTGTRYLTIFAIAVIVLVPAGLKLAEIMNKSAYGSYIDQLEEQIQQMEKVS